MKKFSDDIDLRIENLGPPKIITPVHCFETAKEGSGRECKNFITDNARILLDDSEEGFMRAYEEGEAPLSLEMAGPRYRIFFDSSKVKCAIVTCGGLCPGLNDVIRAIVLELYYIYHVHNIIGIKFGYQGFIPEFGHDVMMLNPPEVAHIHELGGTILGTSRGIYPIEDMVDSIERLNINILFTIGGDGTLRAAEMLSQVIQKRGTKIAVVGIPKTIDNDISLLDKSFGFDTAVEIGAQSIRSAHTEAQGAPNGIGLVKLMGRHSGFIAAHAALAMREVNFVLVPEADFDLEGPQGILAALRRRLNERGHAVIVVAEGAGQKFFADQPKQYDASGNLKLGNIGTFLVDRIGEYFHRENMHTNLRYIDPSYIVRSQPASFTDRIFCGFLGQNAVHAGMAGKTNMLVGYWNNKFVHLPIRECIRERKQLELEGNVWLSVLESTGQRSLKN
jgi:6-phosphofructokinase 1